MSKVFNPKRHDTKNAIRVSRMVKSKNLNETYAAMNSCRARNLVPNDRIAWKANGNLGYKLHYGQEFEKWLSPIPPKWVSRDHKWYTAYKTIKFWLNEIRINSSSLDHHVVKSKYSDAHSQSHVIFCNHKNVNIPFHV